jgi:Zn-dependent M28 family amino/carboxypeptidase
VWYPDRALIKDFPMLRSVTLVLLALSTSAFAQTAPAPNAAPTPAPGMTPAQVNAALARPLPADQAAMKAHVLFLASDAMKGREAGSPEYDIAAQYVAAQFYAAGLKPGGDEGGYLQRVPLVAYKPVDKGTVSWTPRGGAAVPMVFGEDYVPTANPAAATTNVSAPVVFVGYGISAPQYKHDDYKGVDVRGKIVAFVGGAPESFGGEERAFFGQGASKATAAAARGAVGAISLSTRPTPAAMAGMAQRVIDTPRITWGKPDGTGNGAAPIPVLASISAGGGAKLFGANWAAITAAAGTKVPVYKSVTMPGTLSVATATSFVPTPSSNVIGMIPGSDPVVGKEVVVLSAHLDHIGVSPQRAPAAGAATEVADRINNGALDNAIGIASLIEEAKRFTASGKAPRRTVMFLAVTAEEKGLVGSDYFANNPTVPLANIVANVNLDMPILLYPFEDMIVYGAERSTLGPIVRRAVNSVGVDLSPDPMPSEGIFVRSDHFRFVQKGVPSVFLWPGQKGPGAVAVADFMGKRYHRPGDDLTQPILWDQGVRFVGVNYAIAREIADGDQRPVWNKGDYFGTTYKGPMAK